MEECLLFTLTPCWFLFPLNLQMVESSQLPWLHRARAVLVFALFGSLTGICSLSPSVGSLYVGDCMTHVHLSSAAHSDACSCCCLELENVPA